MSEKPPNPVLLETPQGPFTLLDLFAAACLTADRQAPGAYASADAMLKERAKHLEPRATPPAAASCEKCGSGDVAWWYNEGRRPCLGPRKEEHIDLHCLRCGWGWESGVLEAPE